MTKTKINNIIATAAFVGIAGCHGRFSVVDVMSFLVVVVLERVATASLSLLLLAVLGMRSLEFGRSGNTHVQDHNVIRIVHVQLFIINVGKKAEKVVSIHDDNVDIMMVCANPSDSSD